MNLHTHSSKTSSRQKIPGCGFASRENRLERRTGARVWQRQRVKLASGKSLYNYFRDYDPGTGRYIESDPVGLGAGLSIYAYVGGNPLIGIDPLGLMITGTWIKPPRFNIQNYGIDRVEGVAPSWSWWGYVKFVRLSGHAEGFVNVDVKCHDDCKDWEIHNNISVEVNGYLDVGPNVYAIAGGLASRNPYVGIGLNVVLAGGSLLQAEHHFLNLVNQKAESIISALSAKGPTTVCLGSTLK